MLDVMKKLQLNSYLFGGNSSYLEELYESYLNNPVSVSDKWRECFDTLQSIPATKYSSTRDISHSSIIKSIARRTKSNMFIQKEISGNLDVAHKQAYVQSLINGYRLLGSQWANLDPLNRYKRPEISELDIESYNFSETDLDKTFSTDNLCIGLERASLRDIIKCLRDTYCGTIGIEYMHTRDLEQKRWWQKRLESIHGSPGFSVKKKKHILRMLTAAEGFERYLHTKYVGQKRFSLEGSESFIVSMDEIVQYSGKKNVQEIVIGMAHRGRLNVLVNILGKMPSDLFSEFEGKCINNPREGDVKYHKGFSSNILTEGGPVHLSLAFNPSHLEIINPVIQGSVKARMDRRGDYNGCQVLPVQVHGDAAFIGQGVVMETLNLSKTRGYGTHGTLHIIINNQIGFTTSDSRDIRSTLHCTDIVKMIEAPVLHVNGDDPEAVVFATQIAIDYRMEFKGDVVIDINCFRRFGHNEQDTPSITQPLMYKTIVNHPGIRTLYAKELTQQGLLTEDEEDSFVKSYRESLSRGDYTIDQVLLNYKSKYEVTWMPFLNCKWTDTVDTTVSLSELEQLGKGITEIPANFKIHPLVERVINDRRKMACGEQPIDWGMGEHLAFASLVSSGYSVFLTGQDSGRGTFTHRHAVLHDQNQEFCNNGTYVPLQNVTDGKATFTIIDSVLSEEAVLGFEYGYSTSAPNTLVIWEAQFGDFANGAQIVIDQFISSGEVKWGRLSGLTMLLPHGYEGQGPEHSSARIERFLQLCTNYNMQVVQPTTPSQIFHLLRRQMKCLFRKPLIIATPKSLLRHKEAVSSLSELSVGLFHPILGEIESEIDQKKVKRILVCSGRVYYDLIAHRRKTKSNDIMIMRIEQLYPFENKQFKEEIKKCESATEVVWVQDEPRNQGPWSYIKHYMKKNIREGQKLWYSGRPSSASPSVGCYSKHCQQQKELIEKAFSSLKNECVSCIYQK